MAINDSEPTLLAVKSPLPRLIIENGPQMGKSFVILGEPLTIGRGENTQITLQDQMASRRHACIDCQQGQTWIQDLGSSNGTFVNNVQVTQRRSLKAGDRILIGQTVLLFHTLQVQSAPPAEAPADATVIMKPARRRTDPVPSRLILETASQTNSRLGNENLGFLSPEKGLMPAAAPILLLPPGYEAWDEMAESLPELYRTLQVRKALEAMPVLSAARETLPDEYLLRASAIMSMLAHSYHRVEADPPQLAMPEGIQRPWKEISQRLNRPAPHLSYIDLIMYNWRMIDPQREDPMRVENLRLLVPTVDNREERIFYLTQVEILAQSAPIIEALVRAQEAAARDDTEALKQELLLITERLQHVTFQSFMKINPNPHSDSYVDPVVWAKTVAPFAVPIDKSVAGPSGTSAPIFHVLDAFLGRQKYGTRFGNEMLHLRKWYPRHWQNFIEALGEISVADYVEARGDPALKGIFRDMTQAYAGSNGFLSRHRLKVYGYLDIAFKVGRNVTITGFSGLFKDRTWDQVDLELASSRQERETQFPQSNHHAGIKRIDTPDGSGEQEGGARQVVLDIANTGIRYRPGDRIALLPENSEELIDQTLAALKAKGYEEIALTGEWRQAMQLREGYERSTALPLRTLLKFGRIRPVEREVAKILQTASLNGKLLKIIEARAEDQWELWDLLEMLNRAGFDPKRLWKAHPGEQEHICRVVPPESYRMYSISSRMEQEGAGVSGELDLTVGRLRYETRDTELSRAEKRYGTSSHFLGESPQARLEGQNRVSLRVVHPPHFSLPEDPGVPVVMFAGGTGIAPFRGFIQERAGQDGADETWLFMGIRTREDLFYREELEQAAARGRLKVRIAFSREAIDGIFVPGSDGGHFTFQPGEKRHIADEILKEENARVLWGLLRSKKDGGKGAYFYVCGRANFAKSVMEALKEIMQRYSDGPEAGRQVKARQMLYGLAGEGRYMQDVFTTYTGAHMDREQAYDASEIVLHNNDEKGYWMALNGRVYDLTEFARLHPGGFKIIRGYAGMDATQAYQKIGHHLSPEVDSMLGMYEIGVVRRLSFGTEWGVAIGPDGLRFLLLADSYRAWIRFLYNMVEMENALENDYSIEAQALTAEEGPGSYSPLKLQFLLEAHDRFMVNYMEGSMGRQLENLWAVTSGMCGRDQEVGWIHKVVERTRQTEEADTVKRLSSELAVRIDKLSEGGAGEGDPGFALVKDYCALLKREDQRFLAEMKAALRAGVMVFEQYESETAKRGSARLLEIAREIPRILGSYHSQVLSQALRTLLEYSER